MSGTPFAFLSAGAATPAAPRSPRAWWAPAAIVVLGWLLHAAWLRQPLSVVFDEVYFGRYALAYLKGEDYFDLHPPLAKLVFGAMAWLLQLDPSFSFDTNGLPFPDPAYAWLRLPAHAVGVLLPLVLWGVAREIGLSGRAAFVVGVLAALDNAYLVMSRVALTDMFFITAGFGALWAYLRHRRGGGLGGFWVAALLAGCAVSVKWTALSFVGVLLTLEAQRLWQARHGLSPGGARPWTTLWRPAALLVVPAAVYVATFALHFALVKPPASGDAGLIVRGQLPFAERLVETNAAMWRSSSGMTVHHPYASRWYDWPFMMRPVDMWAHYREDGPMQRLYLIGNPVVWWATGYAMLFLLVNFLPKLPGLLARAKPPPAGAAELFVVGGFLANLLPFTAIARVMFLYHYLPALGFALLGLGLLLDRSGRHARWLTVVLLALAAAAFAYWAPLTYGLDLTQAQFDARFWVRSWK